MSRHIIAIVLAALAGFFMPGCTTTTRHLATSVAVGAYLKNHPEHTQRVIEISTEVERLASTGSFATADQAMAAVDAMIHWDRVDPALVPSLKQLLADIGTELSARIPDGLRVIDTADGPVLQVAEVAGWVRRSAEFFEAARTAEGAG